jgi:CheY-like chemotaxis protein
MTKILIVEDNEMNRDMLSRRLERRGFTVVMAVDGAEGVAMSKTEVPDIVLMDMSLAARLCGEAKGGEVLVSERVVSALSDSIEADRLADVELKGLTQPVPTFLVRQLVNSR